MMQEPRRLGRQEYVSPANPLPDVASARLSSHDHATSKILRCQRNTTVSTPRRRVCEHRRVRVRLILFACSVLMLSACTASGPHHTSLSSGLSPTASPSSKVESGPCFGAAALAAPKGDCERDTNSGTLTPNPKQAAADRADAYSSVSGKGCFAYPPTFPLTTCAFGDASSTTRVALIGNSHAAQWLPAIELIAAQKHWRVTTYLASQCALADVPQHFDTPASTQDCRTWGHQVTAQVAGGNFDLAIMANKVSRGVPGHDIASSMPLFEQGYELVLRPLKDANLPVVGIRDTPSPGFQVPDCLGAHPGNYRACDGTPAKWLPTEPLTAALAAMHDGQMTMIDMTSYICDGEVCPAAVGGVPVYFDVSHLTATYARTLAPYLTAAITRAFPG
jgi:hypothetical protein